LNNILALASEQHVNFLGAVTWAFEFEDQPYFERFRTLASNGIDKPVLNAFRIFGLMGGVRVEASSSGALASEDVVRNGVRGKPDINVIASRTEHEIDILIWNYHDDDLPAPESPIDLVVSGLTKTAERVLVEHFRVDSTHSNAYTEWKAMASPQRPSPAQYQQLQGAGQLQLFDSPSWLTMQNRSLHLQFGLPQQALSLLRIKW
jgi:xylan 1,4-beta-xylosidase